MAKQVASGSSWSKACRCGEVWSETEWRDLPAIGRYQAGREGWIELRTCVCGNAIALSQAELEGRRETPLTPKVEPPAAPGT